MVKRLLSIVLLLAVVGTAFAQIPQRCEFKNPQRLTLKKADPKNIRPMKVRAFGPGIELTDDQMWFSYGDDSEASNMGLAMNADYNIAVYVPFNKIAGKGSTVDGIRFLLPAPKAKNLVAWVGTELPGNENYSKGNLEIKPVATSDIVLDGYTEVAFSKSYEIPESGLWVGYSFDIEGLPDEPDDSEISDDDYMEWYYNVYVPWLNENLEDAYPFMVSDLEEPIEGTFQFACKAYDDIYRLYAQLDPEFAEEYLSMIGWDDYSTYGYAVALDILIGGGKFLNNAASVEDLGQKYVKINDEEIFFVNLTNNGKNGINDFTYEVAINGQKVDEKTVTLDEPLTRVLSKTSHQLTLPTGDKTGVKEITLTITKVNGQPNEIQAVAKGTLIVLAETPQMKPLVEEYTGTWCGWCTRGWVAMEKLTEDYKDQAVIYAIHNGDPMEIGSLFSIVDAHADGFPSLTINRSNNIDPYYGNFTIDYGVKYDMVLALAQTAPAAITVKATWADSEKTKVNIETATTAMYDVEDSSLGIGYILVADGLTGTGRDWAQANYYAGSTEDLGEDLQKLATMGDYITNMEYNHVAIAAWGAQYGVEGSLKGILKAGEPFNETFVADLSTQVVGSKRVPVLELIKDKKLHVVAYVVNRETGEVLNSNEVLLDAGSTDIQTTLETSSAPSESYNIFGQRIPAPQKGVSIVRLPNGKTIKVFVK